MKESIQVTTIAQIESVDLSVLLWLNNLIENQQLLERFFWYAMDCLRFPLKIIIFLKT